MSDIIERLKAVREEGDANCQLVGEAIEEIVELRKLRDSLEEILIVLARTPLPWDEEGRPTEGLPHFEERYTNAIHEAAHLLGLDLRSTITRTEPRT